jgi:transcriptional regulator with XRE-family HTH domain
MTANQRIGRNIRRIRRAADLSQEACAERAGIHRTMISLYEWGEREPLTLSFLKLAAALDVELAVLAEGVRWEPGSSGPGRWVIEEDPK